MYKVIIRNGSVFGTEPCSCEFVCDTTDDVSTLPTSIAEGTGGKTKYDNQVCGSGSIAVVVDNGTNPKRYILDNQDVWCPQPAEGGGGNSQDLSEYAKKSDLDSKADASHTHSASDVGADTKGSAAAALSEAKTYTDNAVADLINGAPTTRDTLKEISDLMDENASVVEALDAAIGTKANKTDIPTKTSELENDSGFLTEHQDLSEYAKKTDVPSIKVNSAVNADTVNGHTVNADVPADAKFTDTVPDLSLYALKAKYGDTTIDVGRKADTTVGELSTAEGEQTTASGYASHAEGVRSRAEGKYSHAEGGLTGARGNSSHSEGYGTSAKGICSHAEGEQTKASGYASHAEGYYTTATNDQSHAGGHYNADMTAGGSTSNTVGTAFVIGNGTSSTALSNAFSVMFDGTVKAAKTITASTTADYAEFFEWLDGNPDSEDRVGYFVTMDGDKIRIANPDDDYILGVVSGEPFVLGNGDCDTWNGMFLHDEFRRTIYEPAPKIEEILDDDGNPTGEFEEIEGTFEGIRPKLNPDYDHTKTYTSRFDRPEWAPIGMLGVLAVRHNGTAKVNGYVTVAEGGIAMACDKNAENSYRVIKANTDSVVEIIFR